MLRALVIALCLAVLPASGAPNPSEGVRFFQQGSLDSARLFFEKKLKKNKRDREAQFYLGRLEKEGGRSFQRLSEVVQGNVKDAYTEEALLLLGQYHYARGRYEAAAV